MKNYKLANILMRKTPHITKTIFLKCLTVLYLFDKRVQLDSHTCSIQLVSSNVLIYKENLNLKQTSSHMRAKQSSVNWVFFDALALK